MKTTPPSPIAPSAHTIRPRAAFLPRLFARATLVLGLGFGLSALQAKNWYVSPSGTNAAGRGDTALTPFKTIKYAHDLTVPGDTVYLMEGTYNLGPTAMTITRGGTGTGANQVITYRNYSDNKPVITFTGYAGFAVRANYITLDGLRIQGNSANLTLAGAQEANRRLVENNVFNAAYNGTGVLIEGTSTAAVHHVTFKRGEVWSCPAAGISASLTDYITIEQNNVHENSYYTSFGTSGINISSSKSLDDNTGAKSFIRRNRTWGNRLYIPWIDAYPTPRITDGNGIIVDFNNDTSYNGVIRIENNLAYGNGGRGICVTNTSRVEVYHNTTYNNSLSQEIDSEFSVGYGSNNCRVHNNIFISTRGEKVQAVVKSTGTFLRNNIYWGGARDLVDSTDKVTDPKLENVAYNIFKLTAASTAALNTAYPSATMDDFIGTPRATPRDVGAYEY